MFSHLCHFIIFDEKCCKTSRYLEVAVGQYLGEGGMTLVGKLCPLLGGTGPATMVLVSLLNVYYCVIVGWAIFYLIVSLATLPTLPWDTCGKNVIKKGNVHK